MKICVTSIGNNLEAQVDQRFGRCLFFIIVDSETMQFKAIQNMAANNRGSAGVSSAQLILDEGVEVLITGNVGPNALGALQNSNIKIVTGASGNVKEAVERYLSGKGW